MLVFCGADSLALATQGRNVAVDNGERFLLSCLLVLYIWRQHEDITNTLLQLLSTFKLITLYVNLNICSKLILKCCTQ